MDATKPGNLLHHATGNAGYPPFMSPRQTYTITLEDLRVAQTLCDLMRDAEKKGSSYWSETAQRIRAIGSDLDADGGHPRMVAIALYVGQYARPQRLALGSLLDMTWNGVGSWGSGPGSVSTVFPDGLLNSEEHDAVTNPDSELTAEERRQKVVKRLLKEIAACDDEVSRLTDVSDPSQQAALAAVLSRKVIALKQLQRYADAVEVYDDIVHRFANVSTPILRRRAAEALWNKSSLLLEQARYDAVIATCEELKSRFADIPEFASRDYRAGMLVDKGTALRRLGRPTEAIASYDELIAVAGEEPLSKDCTLYVAHALLRRGEVLEELRQDHEALVAYAELVRRFDRIESPAVQKQVTEARRKQEGVADKKRRREEAERRQREEQERLFQLEEQRKRAQAGVCILCGRKISLLESLSAQAGAVFGKRHAKCALFKS